MTVEEQKEEKPYVPKEVEKRSSLKIQSLNEIHPLDDEYVFEVMPHNILSFTLNGEAFTYGNLKFKNDELLAKTYVFPKEETTLTIEIETKGLYGDKSEEIFTVERPTVNQETIAKAEEELKKAEAEMQAFENLKSKFNYKYDEFNDSGHYAHKRWDGVWPRRKTITGILLDSGHRALYSNYFGSDWLFHEKIHVIVGDKKYTSETVGSLDDSNNREVVSGGVFERITFVETQDNGILKAIAQNTDKEIKVRFEGDKYSDATLSNQDVLALKDVYDLSEKLKNPPQETDELRKNLEELQAILDAQNSDGSLFTHN